MKKLIFAVAFIVIGWSVVSRAVDTVIWRSSNTATADTTKGLCLSGTPARGVLHGLCINTGTAGTLTVYASSATANNPVAAVSTANVGCLYYDVYVSSGLTYTNSATANVTLMYDCY